MGSGNDLRIGFLLCFIPTKTYWKSPQAELFTFLNSQLAWEGSKGSEQQPLTQARLDRCLQESAEESRCQALEDALKNGEKETRMPNCNANGTNCKGCGVRTLAAFLANGARRRGMFSVWLQQAGPWKEMKAGLSWEDRGHFQFFWASCF